MYDLTVQLNQIGSSAYLVLEFNHHVQVGTIWFPLWRVPGSLANHNAVPQSTTQLHCDWLNCLVRCGPERKPYGLYFSMQQNCFQTYRLVCSNKQKLTISKLKLDTKVDILGPDCSHITFEQKYVLISNFGTIIWGHLIGHSFGQSDDQSSHSRLN